MTVSVERKPTYRKTWPPRRDTSSLGSWCAPWRRAGCVERHRPHSTTPSAWDTRPQPCTGSSHHHHQTPPINIITGHVSLLSSNCHHHHNQTLPIIIITGHVSLLSSNCHDHQTPPSTSSQDTCHCCHQTVISIVIKLFLSTSSQNICYCCHQTVTSIII